MDARNVILRPIITEASMNAMDSKKYTFEVDVRAKKPLIKKSVEEIFGVKVDKVNVVNTAKKPKRMGKYEGYTKKRRKAIITLSADSNDIALFGDEE
ncbi:50S ribosomal protein L23 [Alkalibacterium olivapovliticus]|uniref:Large ribosomal subunit protein uL23 n=1 Tax=Alkalibacterium olivapovliticus TaxID=99907 RepID=A0A2T0W6Q9_9LACT|nr:50S ribosomal protein L23 [Alkalibacterium olivapovliticus]PRY82400.1 large subunit ribosomal protein L23 [Alkalibacterium olivapovliticus]